MLGEIPNIEELEPSVNGGFTYSVSEDIYPYIDKIKEQHPEYEFDVIVTGKQIGRAHV